ncbi:DEAD/DEAH box helicase [Pseudonocardia eucalypti]|uniref:DEAD/DEAH box helicase n=1 Tax=Pseudonocardia eucalypti TaxID=648755 RepID=A0ABP9REM0_9PSEU|nr:superfamily II RNA helicase [Pseudonocardia eucalypti]
MNLTEKLPDTADADALYDAFTLWTTEQGITLYPAQEEALIEIVSGSNVILATPTGSGKSLVATGAHFAALAQGIRSFYTAPIKALVSEKFFALCEVFGAEQVGMMTGDSSINPGAPIICCTAEVLANIALRHGGEADAEVAVGQVVMDEFHFYADPERGWAWQVPLIELPHTQFLLMSATLGDVTRFKEDLTRRTGQPTTVVSSGERPVPLMFSYASTPLHETVEELLYTKQAPVYVVHFTQVAAIEHAQALMSINVCSREEKDQIAELIGGFRFAAGFGRTLSRLVRHGIGVHHAGMLPKYRRLVERLTQSGLLKVVCGTDTLGVGINVPIRTVVFTGLVKYDGTRSRMLNAREFHQIAGRAGRAGYDTVGTVVVQAPEHVVQNQKALAKAGQDPKKRRKVVRKQPREGEISWSEAAYERLVAAQPEPLRSSFRVSHAMLLNVINRPGDTLAHMRHLLEDNHEDRPAQRKHILRAIAIYRALLAGGVVEQLPEPDTDGRRAKVTVDLQMDFALNQPLSPFALAAVELLDRESPDYPLDVLSVLEATLDDPKQVLLAQRSAARRAAIAEMKADGLDYDERTAALEEISWPQPLAEELDAAYQTYRRGHPWVADFELSPKSVSRDLYERSMTFVEYIGHYQLARSEGLVLRYLTNSYKALRQTVPEEARTEGLADLIELLGELVREVDSSLLDEWEKLANPDASKEAAPGAAQPRPVTVDPRALRVLVRNAMFRRVQLAARKQWYELGELDPSRTWDADQWQLALEPYFEQFDEIRTDAHARGPDLFRITEADGRWEIHQVLDDPDGYHEWFISADLDLETSHTTGTPALKVTGVQRF